MHLEIGLSLSRSLESTKHHSEPFNQNFRILSEGRKHVPPVQCTMPFVQYVMQLWHCTLEVIFANLEVFNVSHALDHFLRLFAEWIERVILLQVGLQTLLDSDAFSN